MLLESLATSIAPAAGVASAMTSSSRLAQRLFLRKSIADLQREASNHGLKRTLGPANLLFLGIGCILGAGIYVMTGTAAASFAGPAVILSFLIAGAACALTGLCYAELASAIPVSGASYTYCYAAIGEIAAWVLGWLLVFEYGLAAGTLAVGFSGYFVSLLGDFGVAVPAAFATPTVQSTMTPLGMAFVAGDAFNLIAVLAIAAVTIVLTLGVTESAFVNNIMVAIKVCVLVAFIVVGVHAVNADNWTPFIPPNEGDFTYGWQGVMRAASLLFFAYIGFETVSTAASEARNPQRDMPIGILGSLAVCMTLYVIVAAILTGIAPYRELGVPDPIAIAVDRMGQPQIAVLVKVGALMGLASVLLVNAYGQSRVSFAMSRDGLLPRVFSLVHPRFRTPWLGTILLGVISALGAAVLPISILGDLASLGIATAFCIVCVSLMWLRTTQPGIARPFRVPFGGVWIRGVWIGYVPAGAILLCIAMIVPVVIDIVTQALRGDVIPASIIGIYLVAGVLIYVLYGARHSTLQARLQAGGAPHVPGQAAGEPMSP
jgi:APA family basic amino acid/polyamine antiporter